MTNNIDVRRLMKVLKHDLKERACSRLGTCVIIACVFLVIEGARLFVFGEEPVAVARVQGVYAFLCFFMVYVPTLVYGDVKDADKGIFYPLLPASQLEKYLSMMLCSVVILPLAFFISLTVIDVILLLLDGGGAAAFELFGEVFGWENAGGLGLYVCTQSVFIAGNLHFKRNSFAKSLLLTLAAFIAYSVIKMISFGQFIMDSEASQIQTIGESDGSSGTLIIWTVTFLLWIFSYFRLKTIEYA